MRIFWPRYAKSPAKITAVLLATICSQAVLADTKIVGYVPAWKGLTDVAYATDFHKLTHVNLAFLSPDATGIVASPNGDPVCMQITDSANVSIGDMNYIVQKAHSAGAKVLISLAGAGTWNCAGNWKNLLKPAKRTFVVNNLIKFVNDNNLDGIDVDIEGDVLTAIDNAGNYTPFIKALKEGLGNKLVTAATGSYEGGMVPVSSLQYFDFVNIMSYDNIGPDWGNAGDEHAPYQMAVDDINLWKSRGLTKEKLVLGVPAYGYGFDGYASDYDYNTIIGTFGASAAQHDVIGTRCAGCMYITYNGLPTIRNKTQLAMQQGSGVMIWELGADTKDSTSILLAVANTIANISSSSSSSNSFSSTAVSSSSLSSTALSSSAISSSSLSSSSKSSSSKSSSSVAGCPIWSDTVRYKTGDIVNYQNNYYIAEHNNPGFVPTISTWYWDPIIAPPCAGGTSSSSSKASSSSKTSSSAKSIAITSSSTSSVSKTSSSASSVVVASSSKSSSVVSSIKSSVLSSSSKSSVPPSSSAISSSSSVSSKSSSSTGGSVVNLDNPVKKEIAMEIVSSAENSSLDWRAQFAYIEDINDGRGYTAGIIGFCSGTGDMLELVEAYTNNYPNNGLASFLPALRKVNGTASHTGLTGFTTAWANEAKKAEFQAAQEKERDDVYFNPSVSLGKSDGISVLGQFAYYDAAVVHGFDGMQSVRARALKKAKTPAQGGNEATYLNAFLDERIVEMKKEAAHEDTSRIDTAQRVFLNNGNLNLNTPLSWKVYGDSFSIK